MRDMNPRVTRVEASNDYTLTLDFENGEKKIFDVSPYLDKGFFRELKDLEYFRSVRATMGTVQWPHGQDFCPDTLYERSAPSTDVVNCHKEVKHD